MKPEVDFLVNQHYCNQWRFGMVRASAHPSLGFWHRGHFSDANSTWSPVLLLLK